VLFKDRDALGYTVVAYMRGRPGDKTIDGVRSPAAEGTGKRRPEQPPDPGERRAGLKVDHDWIPYPRFARIYHHPADGNPIRAPRKRAYSALMTKLLKKASKPSSRCQWKDMAGDCCRRLRATSRSMS
jgi:hypothetical protein